MIPINRKHEAGPIPFRTGRFFCIDSKWFFACREGLDRGPFDTRDDAIVAMQIFLTSLKSVEKQLNRVS